jgi:hypothetical protein
MLRFLRIIFILHCFFSIVAQGSTYVATQKIDRKAVVERLTIKQELYYLF